jgi:hypothetical protein
MLLKTAPYVKNRAIFAAWFLIRSDADITQWYGNSGHYTLVITYSLHTLDILSPFDSMVSDLGALGR